MLNLTIRANRYWRTDSNVEKQSINTSYFQPGWSSEPSGEEVGGKGTSTHAKLVSRRKRTHFKVIAHFSLLYD